MNTTPIKRVALIFDNSVRPDTTGLYCRRALGNLVEVEHFLPSEVSRIPPEAFDLFLSIDDGLQDRLPDSLRPAAFWAIDTHIEFERSRKKAENFDFVFAAQKDGAEKLRNAGIDTALWLPLACDSGIHRPYDVKNTHDVCFVGNLIPGLRTELLEQIRESFPNTFIGRRYYEEMAQAYSSSKIVFNRSVGNDINMRVFEALACGSLLVTNDLAENGQEELFEDGEHLATYLNADELSETIAFYLKHDEPRERLAQAGLGEVFSRHTYLHRMVRLLERIEQGLSSTSVALPHWEPFRRREAAVEPVPANRQQVSACLLSWKRPENVKKIVEQLQQEPLIDDIVVWNNNPDLKLEIDSENVTVINSERNLVTYGRFLCAQQARHDLIYTQDDDCLVYNIRKLYDSFQRDPSCITHGLKLDHLANNAENFFVVPPTEGSLPEADYDRNGTGDRVLLPPIDLEALDRQAQGGVAAMALVGWGAFFRKEWCRVFEEYIALFGEDELLHRKADRIFSLLLGRRHRSLPAEVSDLDGAEGAEALSVRIDHFELTRQAIERSLYVLQQNQQGETMKQIHTEPETTAHTPGHIGATAAGAKDQSYFEFARPELLALVPGNAKRILDVGCGTGKLGQSIKGRQTAVVWGIERDEAVAELARERLDRVLTGDAEQIDTEIDSESLDCIICGDVLEHLREPEKFLNRARSWLADGGQLIASIPNVRHHSVVGSLLAGNWTYESAGLLDQDHVRFFTRREIEKLFYRAGFRIDVLEVVPGPGFGEWDRRGRPGEVQAGRLNIKGLSPSEAEEFYVYQYLISATPDRKTIQEPDTHDQPQETESDQKQQIAKLSHDFPWPESKPSVPVPTDEIGWLADGPHEMLKRELKDGIKLVVELGAWLGLSTRFIADELPQAQVITIDHWKGSPEHQRKPKWKEQLPLLYETFQSLCWDYRERIVPLKMTTLEGLQTVSDYGLSPDLIFFDAEHSYEAVTADLELCSRLFPHAVLVGDDYDDPGVGRAVEEFAARNSLDLQTAGTAWRAWKLAPRKPSVVLPAPSERYPLTSIILVTHGQLPYTKQCLDSIRQFTDEPIELICVDNGSSDGTAEYLRSLDDITLISNSENRGFPAAVNQGIAAAQGEQILLLNNDTIVTTGWLRRMLDGLDSDRNIGLIGPLSNNVSGFQQIPVDYQDLSELDGFAWSLGQHNQGQRTDVGHLVGFCLLIKREVIDRIGLFDERFGIGNFEDDDFCRRATQAGYRVVLAKDAFVHHFGSATFRASDVDFASLLRENQNKYEQKWKSEPAHTEPPTEEIKAQPPVHELDLDGRARTKFLLEQSEEGGLLLKPNNIKLSLCMIVRDNAETIEPCLKSIQPWVDEIVVVDTGSTDNTQEICRRYGARLFQFPWCDDFSAARNESFKHARGEWLFWMDSDDTIPQECGRKLRELADGDHEPNTLGYIIQVHCPASDESGSDMTVVDHVKLVRNRPEIRFEHRIHEQLLPAIRRAGGEVAWTDLYVVHSGSDQTVEGRKRKLERDYRILKLDLQERPDHPFVLFNLGMTYADDDKHEEAIGYLNRCLEVSNPNESHLRKAYALLVSTYSQSNRHQEAGITCRQGLELYPDDKELLFRSAMLHHHLGRLEEAERVYLRILNEKTERHFASLDTGINGYKARHNLAIVYDEMGELEKSETQWRQVVEEQPDYRPGWRGLGESLLKQQKTEELDLLTDQLLKRDLLKTTGLQLQAKAAQAQGETEQARTLLDQAIRAAPDDPEPRHMLAQWLFESDNLADALPVLSELAKLAPEDASVFHNLGSAYLQQKRYDQAASAFKQSLQLRPDSSETQSLLAYALRQMTKPEEAALTQEATKH